MPAYCIASLCVCVLLTAPLLLLLQLLPTVQKLLLMIAAEARCILGPHANLLIYV